MDRFNALPFAERKALTDPSFAPRQPPKMMLPDVVAPSAPAVRVSAGRSRLLRQVLQLAEFFGDQGRPLTDRGNVKLVDAKTLVGLLGTGDRVDASIGDRVYKTKGIGDLPQLDYAVELARRSSALRVVRNKMVAVKAWAKRDEIERASAMVMAVFEIGAQGRRRHMNEWFEDLSAFLDASTPLWLAPNLSTRQPIEVDEIVLITVAAANMSVGAYRPSFYSDDAAFARLIKEEIEGVLLLVVAAGAVEPRGDAFTLMPLGRHAMIDVMRGVGYQFDVIGPVDDASARQLLDILKSVDDDQIDAVWVDWQSGWTGAEKAKALVGVLGDAPSVVDRLHTVQLFDRIGVDAEPSVRTLLHGPMRGTHRCG